MKRKETKKVEEEVTEETPTPLEEELIACNAPAPLVVNGAQYVGCRLVKDHEGNHEIRINWPR